MKSSRLDSLKNDESCVLVLQVGSCWIRLGFHDDAAPRIAHWVHDEMLSCLRKTSSELVDIAASRSEWRETVKNILSRIFGEFGEFPPDRSTVIVLESFRHPIAMREALFDVLFEDFRMASAHAAPDIIMPLLLHGHCSGIVVDIGHHEIRCVPVAFGVPIFQATRLSDGRGAGAVIQRFLQLQAASGKSYPNATTPLPEVCALIDKYCYCKFVCQNGVAFKIDNNIEKRAVTILSDTRWKALEVLFNDDDCMTPRTASSIGELVIDVLKRIDISLRPLVIQNVSVTGGMAMIRGLRERVAIDILKTMDQDTKHFAGMDRNLIIMAPSIHNSLIEQWIGGTIYASAGAELKMTWKETWNRSTEVDELDVWSTNETFFPEKLLESAMLDRQVEYFN